MITLNSWNRFSEQEKEAWTTAQSVEKLYAVLDWLEKLLEEANSLNGVADNLSHDNELFIVREKTYKVINDFAQHILKTLEERQALAQRTA